MRKLILCLGVCVALVAIPTAVAASPTIRLTLIHVMRGCHIWGTVDSRPLGASRTVLLKRGARIEIRINCPMSFDITQLAGPKLKLDASRWEPGTAHTLVFSKPGVYRLKAVNVQTPEERGLDVIGPVKVPVLTVRVG